MKPVKVPGPDGTQVDGTEIDSIESIDRWCEYKLEDGSIIRAKPVIVGFIRVEGQYDPEGSPLYAIRGSVSYSVMSVPESLKKPSA